MNKFTFILSTGRTGTLFFIRLFDTKKAHVLSLHEPKPSYYLRVMSNAHSCNRISESWLLPAFLRARRTIFTKLGDRSYIEANNFIYGFMGVLKNLNPPPTFIHIIRDPRDYIRSYLNHGAWRGRKWLAANIIPYWQPDVRYLLEEINSPITPVTRFAAVWRHINDFLIKHGEGYSNYHAIRFEDIFGSAHIGLEQVIQAIDLPVSLDLNSTAKEKVNPSKNDFVSAWHTWSGEECRAIQRICSPLMERYGYGSDPTWQKKLSNH
jgi:hypothetical protein